MNQERHIEVPRTARYFLNGEIGKQITDVWFACHGYGQLAADFVKEFDCIAQPHRLIVVPEAMSRFYLSSPSGFHGPDSKIGATWMTREDREVEIADYVRYLDLLHKEILSAISATPRITVLGFSQGGATANRWLTRGSSHADRLIMWGSLLPQDADLEQAAEFFRGVALTIVYGTRDQYAGQGVIASYEKLLTGSRIPYRAITFDGGHRMDRDTLRNLTA